MSSLGGVVLLCLCVQPQVTVPSCTQWLSGHPSPLDWGPVTLYVSEPTLGGAEGLRSPGSKTEEGIQYEEEGVSFPEVLYQAQLCRWKPTEVSVNSEILSDADGIWIWAMIHKEHTQDGSWQN